MAEGRDRAQGVTSDRLTMPDTNQFFCRQSRKVVTTVYFFIHNFVFPSIYNKKFGSQHKGMLKNKCLLFVNLWLFYDVFLTAETFMC